MRARKSISETCTEIDMPTYSEESSTSRRSLDVALQEGLLSGVVYNYMSMALSGADTIETFTYKTGGSGGTVVATIVITYTTSDRDVLSSVERTV